MDGIGWLGLFVAGLGLVMVAWGIDPKVKGERPGQCRPELALGGAVS